jgi:hypothetical protein
MLETCLKHVSRHVSFLYGNYLIKFTARMYVCTRRVRLLERRCMHGPESMHLRQEHAPCWDPWTSGTCVCQMLEVRPHFRPQHPQPHTRAHMQTCVHGLTCKQTHTHTHTHIYTHIHRHTDTHARRHTHTHTHARTHR